jgi:hypothetical protein
MPGGAELFSTGPTAITPYRGDSGGSYHEHPEHYALSASLDSPLPARVAAVWLGRFLYPAKAHLRGAAQLHAQEPLHQINDATIAIATCYNLIVDGETNLFCACIPKVVVRNCPQKYRLYAREFVQGLADFNSPDF